jgi:hypothetical protein
VEENKVSELITQEWIDEYLTEQEQRMAGKQKSWDDIDAEVDMIDGYKSHSFESTAESLGYIDARLDHLELERRAKRKVEKKIERLLSEVYVEHTSNNSFTVFLPVIGDHVGGPIGYAIRFARYNTEPVEGLAYTDWECSLRSRNVGYVKRYPDDFRHPAKTVEEAVKMIVTGYVEDIYAMTKEFTTK